MMRIVGSLEAAKKGNTFMDAAMKRKQNSAFKKETKFSLLRKRSIKKNV